MNNKKIIKQTLASLMAMALTVSGGTAIAAPIMSGMTPVTASAVEIDTGLNITETVQTNLDDDLKTALEITSGIIFKALEEVKPYGMFVGPAFEPLIGMFFDGPIDPTQDKLDDINGKLDKVFDRIDELQSTILKGIDKKLGIQSFYEQSLAFASVTEAMNDKINEINADDSLSNYDKMAKIGSLAGNYSEWQAYFEKDMIALNKLTVSPSLDTSGNIFELVYKNCCENAMFSGEALDQAKPICNLVMMNYTAGIMTLTECLSAQYYVNNLPAEAKAQIDPEFMAHICKNNYDIEKELVKVNRYIAGDSEGSGTTFMDLYNNVFDQSRSILVNKGACNIELAPVLQVNNTNEVQDTTQKNKDAQYRTGKISEWFNNNIYNGQVSDSYVKSIVDYAKSHGKTVRTLLNENGFDTSNIPANTPLLSKQAYYDGTCYVVKQHAHSYFDGFNIDKRSYQNSNNNR